MGNLSSHITIMMMESPQTTWLMIFFLITVLSLIRSYVFSEDGDDDGVAGSGVAGTLVSDKALPAHGVPYEIIGNTVRAGVDANDIEVKAIRRPLSQLDDRLKPPPLDTTPMDDGVAMASIRNARFTMDAPIVQSCTQPPPLAINEEEEDAELLRQLMKFQDLLCNKGLLLGRVKLSSRTEGKTGVHKQRVLMMCKVDENGKGGEQNKIDDSVFLQWTTTSKQSGWGLRKLFRNPCRLLLQGLKVEEASKDCSHMTKKVRQPLPENKSFNSVSAAMAKQTLRNTVAKPANAKEPDKTLCLVLTFRGGQKYEVHASEVELKWISKMLKGLVRIKEAAMDDDDAHEDTDPGGADGDGEGHGNGDAFSADDLSSTAESYNTTPSDHTPNAGRVSLAGGGFTPMSASASGHPSALKYNNRRSGHARAYFHVPVPVDSPTLGEGPAGHTASGGGENFTTPIL